MTAMAPLLKFPAKGIFVVVVVVVVFFVTGKVVVIHIVGKGKL